jgi:hypothetical protein
MPPRTRSHAPLGPRPRMEHLWSRAVAIGGNRWQMGQPPSTPQRPATVATGCDQLPIGAHGKEGVDGSSPSEGLDKVPANRHFAVACVKNARTHFGHISGARDTPRRRATSSGHVLARRSCRVDLFMHGSGEFSVRARREGPDRRVRGLREPARLGQGKRPRARRPGNRPDRARRRETVRLRGGPSHLPSRLIEHLRIREVLDKLRSFESATTSIGGSRVCLARGGDLAADRQLVARQLDRHVVPVGPARSEANT